MAGLITAASVAHYSNQRARVLVVDRNPAAEPGKKTRNGWTCGDAVSRNSLNYLASNLGIQYGRPEVEHDVKGIYVYSPDHKTKVLFEGEGHLLNRKLAPRRQVKDAQKILAEASAIAEKRVNETFPDVPASNADEPIFTSGEQG